MATRQISGERPNGAGAYLGVLLGVSVLFLKLVFSERTRRRIARDLKEIRRNRFELQAIIRGLAAERDGHRAP